MYSCKSGCIITYYRFATDKKWEAVSICPSYIDHVFWQCSAESEREDSILVMSQVSRALTALLCVILRSPSMRYGSCKKCKQILKTEQQIVVTTIGLVQMTATRINKSRQISIETPLVTFGLIIEIVWINKIVPMKWNGMV